MSALGSLFNVTSQQSPAAADEHILHDTIAAIRMVKHRSMIGGPGTSLPRPIESFLSWSLCISCLAISGYHYCVSTYFIPFAARIRHMSLTKRLTAFGVRTNTIISSSAVDPGVANTSTSTSSYMKYWMPLTTHSRNELDRKSPMQRYQQLLSMFKYYGININLISSKTKSSVDVDGCEEEIKNLMRQEDKLIQLLRENTVCRHLASLAMRPYNNKEKQSIRCTDMRSSLLDEDLELPLACVLARIWPKLLKLPPHENVFHDISADTPPTSDKNQIRISVVIPSYSESGELLEKQLLTMLKRCIDPASIEVIVVDAGGRTGDKKDELQHAVDQFQPYTYKTDQGKNETCAASKFGQMLLLEYKSGGGRGPCLNFGANTARGEIITFCHLDTTLPLHWDEKIYKMLKNDENAISTRGNSCAFAFGIDTSPQGLSNSFSSSSKTYYPPGIKAVETTANIRTRLYSLPYGDQAISVPKAIFDFIGGFPDQCLMEDYELVALLRKRAALLDDGPGAGEALKIIPGEPALCSPRRWQKFGVLFVTFMNSKFVNLYAGGLGPDQLYALYYGCDPPKRGSELSPWEVEMDHILSSSACFLNGKKEI